MDIKNTAKEDIVYRVKGKDIELVSDKVVTVSLEVAKYIMSQLSFVVEVKGSPKKEVKEVVKTKKEIKETKKEVKDILEKVNVEVKEDIKEVKEVKEVEEVKE